MDSVALSLERLQTDHIDLYQIHQSDSVTTTEETMRALDDLVRQGMVRYVGVSNWEAWRIMKANGIAAQRGWGAGGNHAGAYYSVAGRDLEQELVPLMADQGIGCLVWSPLAGGYLAGKIHAGRRRRRTGPPRQFRFSANREGKGRRHRGGDAADRQGAWRVGGAGWRWPGCAPSRSSPRPSIGAKTLAQLNDNLEAVTLTLTPEEIAALDAVSADRAQYPHWMIKRNNATPRARLGGAAPPRPAPGRWRRRSRGGWRGFSSRMRRAAAL